MFWSWGRVLFITNCYSSLNLGPPFLIKNKKDIPWNGTILSHPGGKIQKTSSRQDHDHCLLGLWRSDSCRWDADRVENQLVTPMSGCWYNSRSASKKFRLTKIQYKCASAGNSRMHTSLKTREAITKFGQCYTIHSTAHIAPSVFRILGALKDAICSMKSETRWCDSRSEDLAMWAGQGIHICSLLVQGHRSGHSLCGKIGYGVKRRFMTERIFVYVLYRFQNVILRCLTPRLHCFPSSHWPSFRFLSFMVFLIPSIQFFFGLPRALFCFGIHFNAILGTLPSVILWTWPYHVSWFCSISFIIGSSNPICFLISQVLNSYRKSVTYLIAV